MIEYLDLEDLLVIARHAVGEDVAVRDFGLLESALARPRASVFGQDAYPDLHLKAAALMHSLARNHALVDGNKRLAWTACRTFLALNGQMIRATEDERFDFVMRVATGAEPELDYVAETLRTWSYQDPPG
ncbi:death-on-curing family protein [Mycolicibacterium chubuense NBB4]|uniref:Death-on-curing family protein n=1 Tax=Mycolicibacterium chubuense (strain NBB4) TaxID=710421 RepID=I4BEC3_MYCCN|nr:type II toxin-antitoxin system death-on-curing family toxin [Mycolicibacterium chubuense]AFM15630.1 death-on-curing family protein [Mycolicibacterium chubuense NBB4]